jgi:hypothetical protein
MLNCRLLIATTVLLCHFAGPRILVAEPPATSLLNLHLKEAESYRMYRDKDRKQLIEFHAKPIFTWTNLVGEHTQYGHIFIWAHAGRPEVIGTMFSTRASDFNKSHKRMLVHEFHTLSTGKLFPVTPERSAYQWMPEKGIVLLAAEEAPPVADECVLSPSGDGSRKRNRPAPVGFRRSSAGQISVIRPLRLPCG